VQASLEKKYYGRKMPITKTAYRRRRCGERHPHHLRGEGGWKGEKSRRGVEPCKDEVAYDPRRARFSREEKEEFQLKGRNSMCNWAGSNIRRGASSELQGKECYYENGDEEKRQPHSFLAKMAEIGSEEDFCPRGNMKKTRRKTRREREGGLQTLATGEVSIARGKGISRGRSPEKVRGLWVGFISKVEKENFTLKSRKGETSHKCITWKKSKCCLRLFFSFAKRRCSGKEKKSFPPLHQVKEKGGGKEVKSARREEGGKKKSSVNLHETEGSPCYQGGDAITN